MESWERKVASGRRGESGASLLWVKKTMNFSRGLGEKEEGRERKVRKEEIRGQRANKSGFRAHWGEGEAG